MKAVAVDLDGVLARYEGWAGLCEIGDPIPHARWFMEALATMPGAEVVVYTTRANPDPFNTGEQRASPEQLEALIAGWLDNHDIPYDRVFIGRGKPIAAAYVDDRAVCCDPQRYLEEGEETPFVKATFADVLRECRKLVEGRR